MTQVYDKSIIKSANSLIEGQGDGRISEHDMEELLKFEYNTYVQMDTLLHIVNTYKLTEPARKKFLESLKIVTPRKYTALMEMNDNLKAEIEGLNVEIAYLKKESGHVGGQ